MATLKNTLRTPDHPPYAEMIRVAIVALDEKDGSTEAAISEYIESSYPDLPRGHANLLAYHIRKLTRMGEFVMGKNNRFMVPSPTLICMESCDKPGGTEFQADTADEDALRLVDLIASLPIRHRLSVRPQPTSTGNISAPNQDVIS